MYILLGSGFPLECPDKKSGLFQDFTVLDTPKNQDLPFRASNNKFDNNNCNIWAQDADEYTINTNCSTCNCKYTYKIASLVHRNWHAGWINFSGPLWPKVDTFSRPISKFRTFRAWFFVLHFSGFFRTRGNPVGCQQVRLDIPKVVKCPWSIVTRRIYHRLDILLFITVFRSRTPQKSSTVQHAPQLGLSHHHKNLQCINYK